MAVSKEELLIEDYRTSLELLKHEDDRKANLLTMFFLIQGGLFAFYGWIMPTSKTVAIALSILAVLFSIFWFFVMERLRAFIRLRVFQLRQIEKVLSVITTVTNEETLRSARKIELHGQIYKLAIHQRLFSVSKIESILPAIVGAFWALIAGATIFELI
jgi:hypothetical protein